MFHSSAIYFGTVCILGISFNFGVILLYLSTKQVLNLSIYFHIIYSWKQYIRFCKQCFWQLILLDWFLLLTIGHLVSLQETFELHKAPPGSIKTLSHIFCCWRYSRQCYAFDNILFIWICIDVTHHVSVTNGLSSASDQLGSHWSVHIDRRNTIQHHHFMEVGIFHRMMTLINIMMMIKRRNCT